MTNIEIVRAHYAASMEGNVRLMMANVSPQVRWTEMAGFPCAGTWVGPQAVALISDRRVLVRRGRACVAQARGLLS